MKGQKQIKQVAIDAMGDPDTMTDNAQHNVVLKTIFQALELARLGGFHPGIIAEAAASAVVSYTANLAQVERNDIAASLRRAADEIQTTDVDDVTTH